jgi:hypothetical protein
MGKAEDGGIRSRKLVMMHPCALGVSLSYGKRENLRVQSAERIIYISIPIHSYIRFIVKNSNEYTKNPL